MIFSILDIFYKGRWRFKNGGSRIGIVEPFRLLIILLFETKVERFDATQIDYFNTLQYTMADPWYAISRHSGDYSGRL